MAENLTIARPYAKAVFEQALGDHGVSEWEQILQALAATAEDTQVNNLLDSPGVEAQQWLALFTRVVEKLHPSLAAKRQTELKNFLTILIEEKRVKVLPEILSRYQNLVAAQQELKEVLVTSAFPLDGARQQNMTESLARYLNSKVAVEFQIDPSLIGGVLIRSGSWVMDGSIKGKLQAMRNDLQRGRV